MKNTLFPLLFSAGLLLTACNMAPEYEQPKSPVPEQFSGDKKAEALGENHTANIAWQDFIQDERLRALVDIGLKNNRDIRKIILSVEMTRAMYDIQFSQLLPSVYGNAGFTRTRVPNTLLSSGGRESTINQFDLNVGIVSYEADIWGRVRNLSDKALETFLAKVENMKFIQMTLVSQIALQYFSCELINEQCIVAEKMLESSKKYLELIQKHYENEVASELDLYSARAQYQGFVDAVAQLKQSKAQSENAMSLLLGNAKFDYASLPKGKSLFSEDAFAKIQTGLSSELLKMRPDIKEAEHRLKAANADIGAAEAAFFPKISLTGSVGLTSSELSDLFKGDARTWAFVPQISIPIFTGGRLRAELDVAKLSKEVEVANYEQAIQNAFREVSDELATLSFVDERVVALKEIKLNQEKRFLLTKEIYEKGSGAYLDVLLAEQATFSAEQNLFQIEFSKKAAIIRLYKALGGGWVNKNNIIAEKKIYDKNQTPASQTAEETEDDDAFLVPSACEVWANQTI